MRLLIAALVTICSLGASNSFAIGFKLPTKCNIPITYRQVFDYIHSFAGFQKHILHYLENEGFPDHARNDKQAYAKIMRTLSSKIEDRLLGDDIQQTRQALLFYADSLRMVRVYQRIDKKLGNENTLIALLEVWEPTVKKTLRSKAKIDAKHRARMLKTVETTLTKANVEAKKIDSTLTEFTHLTQLANEMGANPTFQLFREAHQITRQSAKVTQISSLIRRAALLSMIRRTSGELSLSDFDRSVRKIIGQ